MAIGARSGASSGIGFVHSPSSIREPFMFQSFDDVSDSTESGQRVADLRKRFDALGIA